MKILYINALYSPMIRGGAEISLKTLVENMHAAGHEVSVLSLKPEGSLSFDWVDGIKVYRAPLKNVYWPFEKIRPMKISRLLWHLRDQSNRSMQQAVREVLAQEKPDIVSCHNLVGWSIAIWEEVYRADIPIVQVLHDLYLLCANSDMFKGDQSCTKQCFSCAMLRSKHQKLSMQVDAVVGISRFILERFHAYQYFERAKQYVIYNTREIAAPPLPVERAADQPIKIGYIGTLAEKKGIEWLIEAFSELTIPAHLFIAGGGKQHYEAYLQNLAQGSDITFVGYVDPADFYQSIDVLIVPSLWQEPLGMVAIEALANHVPVIANSVGGLKETIQHEVNGLLCDHTHPYSLKDAMIRLHDDIELYRRLVQNARPSVANILSKDRMVQEYSTVLHETISKHRS